jgi:hypothetical protein
MTRRVSVFSILGILLAATVASAGDAALDRVIGPVQGRSGPPYVEASISIDISYFQQNKAEQFQSFLDGLATKSDMNVRILKMSVNQKICQLTRATKVSLPAVAQRFKGSTSITVAVKKNGNIELKGVTAQPSKKKL